MSGIALTHFELKALIATLEERLLYSDENSCKRIYNSPGGDLTSHLCETMAESEMAARMRLADLEINRLELTLRAAKEDRRDVYCAHGRIVNSKSFINRLPYDIIVDIFGRCVGRRRRATSIQSLSNTCHHWRNMMLNTPRFWNHIAFNVRASVGILSPNKIHTYSRRSNRLPLLISINTDYPPPVDLETIMHTLEPYLSRCTHLEITIPQTFAQRIFAATPLHLLRSVSFSRSWESCEPDEDYSVNLSRNAPLLDYLHLDKRFAMPQLIDWSPERIVHLSITDTSLLRFPPVMPCLETLSLHHSFSDPATFLDFLDASPSLRTLRLSGDYHYASWVLQDVKYISENHIRGQGVRPLGSVRSVYVSQVDHPDGHATQLADVARYHLDHPAVNGELVFVLNRGLGGSLDNLAPPLRELVAAYLPTSQVLLAFDDEDICTACAT